MVIPASAAVVAELRGRYRVKSDLPLTAQQIDEIGSIPTNQAAILSQRLVVNAAPSTLLPPGPKHLPVNPFPVKPLGGRTMVYPIQLTGVGSVMVKPYSRGGIIRWMVSNRYLRWGESRAELERCLLRKVRSLGVNAPEPVASITEDVLWYRCWLLSREIEGHVTLADLSLRDQDAALAALEKLMPQLTILINNDILHLDLHPGNVLVKSDDSVWIVDFDKATVNRGSEAKLRDLYARRWRRAVIKHGLPDVLSEFICHRLLIGSSS